MEGLDQSGSVIRVHPKRINGKTLDSQSSQHSPPRPATNLRTGAEMSDSHIAKELKKVCPGKYDAHAISRAAFIIHQQSDIYISSKTENILLTLMAMDMGEEFELSEQEFCDLLSELPES